MTRDIVDRIRDALKPNNLQSSIEKNFELGKRYFSYEVLEQKLLPIIESLK